MLLWVDYSFAPVERYGNSAPIIRKIQSYWKGDDVSLDTPNRGRYITNPQQRTCFFQGNSLKITIQIYIYIYVYSHCLIPPKQVITYPCQTKHLKKGGGGQGMTEENRQGYGMAGDFFPPKICI